MYDMCILDLVIIDEFSEPMHYTSWPQKFKNQPIFNNRLNLDMGSSLLEDDTEIFSLEYEFFAPNVQKQPGKRIGDVILQM
jgi:hypothetical protein